MEPAARRGLLPLTDAELYAISIHVNADRVQFGGVSCCGGSPYNMGSACVDEALWL